jgi:hypothetical protein
MIGRCGDDREVIVIIRRCGDDQEVWCRGGEWVSAARREHSREVVRQRMLHLERGGMSCGTRPHDWKAHELESIKRTVCLRRMNECMNENFLPK